MLVSQDSHARACIHQRVHGLRQPARRHAFPKSCSDLPLRPRGSPSGYVAERKRQTLCASGCVQVRSSGVCMHACKFVCLCTHMRIHTLARTQRAYTRSRTHSHAHPPTNPREHICTHAPANTHGSGFGFTSMRCWGNGSAAQPTLCDRGRGGYLPYSSALLHRVP